ncbi:molybdopterin-dependent oxidoreductase [Thermomicrobium sp. 4228-Ro]|uniref:molybdopterin-dependent oxidoreductase n=1 Tax=Thermomicrobium sp. 4228-Ro TaxID=2993937 RepID=UPI002248EA3C|nr:molybdopterin-dependent oxidoreductase [Thermomicrobium sp. 4228-Ro]MCX2727576.1 molybdopterin-dependent oxidoreductase [Thermomicrobium sp. 4228-Ro]
MSRGRAVSLFLQGAVVGLLWGIVALLAEFGFGHPGIVGRLLEGLTRLVPLGVQNWALGSGEAWTKVAALLALLFVGAVATGAVVVLAGSSPQRRVPVVVVYAGAVGLLQVFASATHAFLLAVSLADTMLLGIGLVAVTEPGAVREQVGRRQFVRGFAALGLVVGAVGAARALWLLRARSQPPAAVDERGLPPPLTPISDFYVVSKNLGDPDVSLASWRLEVRGQVQRQLVLDMAALRQRPATRQIVTLECISNDVWGPYISNGEWVGIPLRDILLEAGPIEPVVDVVFTAADGYSDSIPFSLALEPSVLLAYALNGEPLPREHGFPLRLVVPGIYGMKNVKWITGIELSPTDYRGFWQQRGWSDVAIVQIHSRIDTPRGGATVPVGREVFIGGIAFAGDRGIARIELSTDGGESWREAEREQPLSPYSWVRWWTWWQPPAPGRYRLVVRAWDGQGNLQVEDERPPLPDGATGWHRITVEARAGA